MALRQQLISAAKMDELSADSRRLLFGLISPGEKGAHPTQNEIGLAVHNATDESLQLALAMFSTTDKASPRERLVAHATKAANKTVKYIVGILGEKLKHDMWSQLGRAIATAPDERIDDALAYFEEPKPKPKESHVRVGKAHREQIFYRVEQAHEKNERLILMGHTIGDRRFVHCPLCTAAANGQWEETEKLLKSEWTCINDALNIACTRGRFHVVALLLSNSADPATLEFMSAAHISPAIRDLLLFDDRLNPATKQLFVAAKVEELILKSNLPSDRLKQEVIADITCNNLFILTWACQNNQAELLRFLLQDERIHPEEHAKELFKSTILKKHTNILEILLNDPRITPNDHIFKGERAEELVEVGRVALSIKFGSF